MTTTLGAELKRLRKLKSETLRQVEDVTKVSNAYLSQMETDKIKEPSPRILQKLAAHYGAPYEYLMQLAGHLEPSKSVDAPEQRTAKLTAMAQSMNDEDWRFIESVFEAWRQRRGK